MRSYKPNRNRLRFDNSYIYNYNADFILKNYKNKNKNLKKIYKSKVINFFRFNGRPKLPSHATEIIYRKSNSLKKTKAFIRVLFSFYYRNNTLKFYFLSKFVKINYYTTLFNLNLKLFNYNFFSQFLILNKLRYKLNLKKLPDIWYFYTNNYILLKDFNQTSLFINKVKKSFLFLKNNWKNYYSSKRLKIKQALKADFFTPRKLKKLNNYDRKNDYLNFWIRYKAFKTLVTNSAITYRIGITGFNTPLLPFSGYSAISASVFKELGLANVNVKRFRFSGYLLDNYDVYKRNLIRITRSSSLITDDLLFFFKNLFFKPSFSSKLSTIFISNIFEQNNNTTETYYYDFFFQKSHPTKQSNVFKKNLFRLTGHCSNFLFNYIFLLLNEPEISESVNGLKNLKKDKIFIASSLNFNSITNYGRSFFKNSNPVNFKNYGKTAAHCNISNILNNFQTLSTVVFSPLLFKFLLIKYFLNADKLAINVHFFTPHYLKFFFYDRFFLENTNLSPNKNFFFLFKKHIIKLSSYQKITLPIIPWYFNTLIRFIEHCSGKRAVVKFNMFLNNYLEPDERARCFMWSQKVKHFRRLLGPRLFLNESLQILYIALKLKDSFFLSNWMVAMFQKISFWKFKVFLRYLKYVLRFFFWPSFRDIKVRGIKIQLKGKISVAGNARTRTVLHRVGETSHATLDNKISSTLSLVRTFTGVQGLKVWFFF